MDPSADLSPNLMRKRVYPKPAVCIKLVWNSCELGSMIRHDAHGMTLMNIFGISFETWLVCIQNPCCQAAEILCVCILTKLKEVVGIQPPNKGRHKMSWFLNLRTRLAYWHDPDRNFDANSPALKHVVDWTHHFLGLQDTACQESCRVCQLSYMSEFRLQFWVFEIFHNLLQQACIDLCDIQFHCTAFYCVFCLQPCPQHWIRKLLSQLVLSR